MNPYQTFTNKPFPRKRSIIERCAESLGLNRFFLREGKRPHVRVNKAILLSPVEGRLHEIRTLNAQQKINGKQGCLRSENYTFDQLIYKEDDRHVFDDGYYFNFYLSPLNLHYVLFPIDMIVQKLTYHPARCRPILFMKSGEVKNERLVIEGTATHFDIPIIVVLIGSFMVSGIECIAEEGKEYQAGELLGGFKLGSTVMILLPKGTIKPTIETGSPVQLSEPVGLINNI